MPRWARVALLRNRVAQSEWRIDPVASTNAAFNLWVAAAPASVSVVRHRLDALLGSYELATHRASDIRLAVTEACTNAIVHAYPDGHGDVLITAETATHELAVTVRDYGAGIPSDTPSNGLGIGVQLIHSLADTVTITNSNPGLAVRMTFRL
jgi:serine/threonine-protein kinase RsbW